MIVTNFPRPLASALLATGLAVLVILVTGCATVAPGTAASGPAAPAEARAAIDLKGRLSLRYQDNGKDEAVHGNFEWRQRPDRTGLTLLSPLGQIQAVIDIAPGVATLTRAGQPPQSAPDVDALLRDTLGWPLPVSGLRDWLQGSVVDAGGSTVRADPRSDAPIATRDGWQVRYVSWSEGDAPHPKRIDLSRHTEQAGQVEVRIVIDEWSGP